MKRINKDIEYFLYNYPGDIHIHGNHDDTDNNDSVDINIYDSYNSVNRVKRDLKSFIKNYPSSSPQYDIHNDDSDNDNIESVKEVITKIKSVTTKETLGGKKQLTNKEKKKIIRRVHKKKHSISSVARSFNISRQAVYNIIKKERETGQIERKEKLTRDDKINIINMVKEDPHITADQIKLNMNLDCSKHTIRKFLNENGFKCINTIHPFRVYES